MSNIYYLEYFNIDYDYYIRQANKEIRNVVDNQLTLF